MPGLAAVNAPSPFVAGCTQALDEAVTDLAWSSAGELLVGCADGGIHVFDSSGGSLRHWTAHRGGISRLCPRPGDGMTLASAGEDGCVRLWNAQLGREECLLAEGNDWVEHLAWTPDGEVLAAAARKTISLWRGAESLGMWYDARRHVLAMAWAPDGRRLATAANKGLYLWRLDNGMADTAEPVQLLTFPGAPVSVAWHPQGQALATGTQDGFLQIWRPASGDNKAKQLTMRGYPGKVSCLAWHPSRAVIATAGGPDVVLWELPGGPGGVRGTPLRHHQSTVTTLAWSADGWLASGDRSGRLCIWDAAGVPVHTRQFDREIAVAQWQPGSSRLAVGDSGGGLHLVSAPASVDGADAHG